MSAAALQPTAAPPAPAAAVAPPKRAIAGLVGILIAAMMAGLNNRVGALALADVRGALGFGLDDASWLTTVYSAGEVIAMPFAAWFAITLSVRRFELCPGAAGAAHVRRRPPAADADPHGGGWHVPRLL
ncbi:hypothetical protein ACQKCR_17580, partial [Comamonas aquatica]